MELKKMLFKVIIIGLKLHLAMCTIDGITFMDPMKIRPLWGGSFPRGEDPCNPLYWYPRNIPEYCFYKTSLKIDDPPLPPRPLPLPIPVPMPSPVPFPIPPIPNLPPAPFPSQPQFLLPSAPVPIQPVPGLMSAPLMTVPAMQFPILPFGVPLNPLGPMLPTAHLPLPSPPSPLFYSVRPSQSGMVPGVPGLVSENGGINVLPFSDAYSDILEKHRQKMIRKRLQRVLDEYEDYPRKFMQKKHGRRMK